MMSKMNTLNLGGSLTLVHSIGALDEVSVNMASAMGVVLGGAAEGHGGTIYVIYYGEVDRDLCGEENELCVCDRHHRYIVIWNLFADRP
jgi:hypothetical protein